MNRPELIDVTYRAQKQPDGSYHVVCNETQLAVTENLTKRSAEAEAKARRCRIAKRSTA